MCLLPTRLGACQTSNRQVGYLCNRLTFCFCTFSVRASPVPEARRLLFCRLRTISAVFSAASMFDSNIAYLRRVLIQVDGSSGVRDADVEGVSHWDLCGGGYGLIV